MVVRGLCINFHVLESDKPETTSRYSNSLADLGKPDQKTRPASIRLPTGLEEVTRGGHVKTSSTQTAFSRAASAGQRFLFMVNKGADCQGIRENLISD